MLPSHTTLLGNIKMYLTAKKTARCQSILHKRALVLLSFKSQYQNVHHKGDADTERWLSSDSAEINPHMCGELTLKQYVKSFNGRKTYLQEVKLG